MQGVCKAATPLLGCADVSSERKSQQQRLARRVPCIPKHWQVIVWVMLPQLVGAVHVPQSWNSPRQLPCAFSASGMALEWRAANWVSHGCQLQVSHGLSSASLNKVMRRSWQVPGIPRCNDNQEQSCLLQQHSVPNSPRCLPAAHDCHFAINRNADAR